MHIIQQNIKDRYFKTLTGELSVADFEDWLYADKDLEKQLQPEDYLDLLSLNFKKKGAKYDLFILLRKHIDSGEFETYRVLKLLKEAQQKNSRLPYILIEFSQLYYDGYTFLQDLGIGFGLYIETPTLGGKYHNSWDELTKAQQEEILTGFSPELEECIELAIHWLETKKIILTGEQDETGDLRYEDLRTDNERKSKVWLKVAEKPKKKLWWEFWK